MIPAPLVLLALALAAFRTFRLATHDDFPPIVRLRYWLVGATFDRYGNASFTRPLLADWLACAWCSGLWWSAGWYGAWLLWPGAVLYAAVPMALSSAVALLQEIPSEDA